MLIIVEKITYKGMVLPLTFIFLGAFPAGTEADVNSKLGVSFSVESAVDGKAIKVHQAFLSLQNTASELTTTFIAEADEKMLYTASCKF